METAIETAMQVTDHLNIQQVLIFLLVVTVLVLLGMVWRAWTWQFTEPARTNGPRPRKRRTRRS